MSLFLYLFLIARKSLRNIALQLFINNADYSLDFLVACVIFTDEMVTIIHNSDTIVPLAAPSMVAISRLGVRLCVELT